LPFAIGTICIGKVFRRQQHSLIAVLFTQTDVLQVICRQSALKFKSKAQKV